MSVTLRRLAEQLTVDRKISHADVDALVVHVRKNGIVSAAEKAILQKLLDTQRDQFEPGAADLLSRAITAGTPTLRPDGATVALARTDEHRPVFLSADGAFTLDASGRPAANATDLGEALFRAGELVDDSKDNVFERLPAQQRERAVDGLLQTLKAAERLPGDQAIQTRASAATLLLHLAEASPEAALREKALAGYEKLVRAEPFPKLRESMIFHLANSKVSQTGAAKQVAQALMTQLAPTTPPYDQWFKNGNKTVNMDWVVGGEFWKGFTNNLKEGGFKPVGAESQYGSTVYERTIDKPGVGETIFRITVRGGSATNLLANGNDPSIQIIGYDGHSNWGRNLSSTARMGPELTDGGAGKLFVANLCVGKAQLDKLREKFPNLQIATTLGSSSVDTDINLLAEKIAARAGWEEIDPALQKTTRWENNPSNWVTPVSTLIRERVLDRDNDGQADYLDKHFNYSTFDVPADTAREFSAVKQSRPAEKLDGTKIVIAGQMINTYAEFSAILSKVNHDSKVVTAGWFEPKLGEKEVTRFERAKGPDGKLEYRMSVSSRYAHMSEEALRAVAFYEWNRFITSEGDLRLSPVDAKLNGLLVLSHSLDNDEASRDGELWGQLLARYNFPQIDRATVQRLLDAEHHDYVGNAKMIADLKAALGPQIIEQLGRPEVGEPVHVIA